MRYIANTNNIAEIQFGVAGGSSVSGKSGAQIVRDLNDLARNISEGQSQPKIIFGVANTADQLSAEITKVMGNKPVMLNFGFGAPSATTKQSVRKYSDELIGEFQNSTGKLQTVLQTAFIKGGKELVFKQFGTSAKDASAEIDRLNGYISKYGQIINSLPKVTEAMHVTEAKSLFDNWMEKHQSDHFIRAKNGAFELESVEKYANSLSLSTNDEIISFFNVIQQGALAADDRVMQLEETLEKFSQEDFSALDMSQLLGSNKFADVLFQRIPETMRTALEDVNKELEANGVKPIDVDRLISFDHESLAAYINDALQSVMHEIDVADPSGAGAAVTALKFKADTSSEAQEELRTSINDLVANTTRDAFTIRFVADTSAEGLAAFSESLNTFSNINNGQPVEVAITAGTSQETIDKLAKSIRGVVEQVEGKEFHVQFAPTDGAVETLRHEVEHGFDEAIGVKLKISDPNDHAIDNVALSQATQALQHHVDALKDAIALEQEKTKVANDLTTALNAEATSIEKAENAKASRKPRQTAEEKKQAELEKLYADKVAEQNRADEKRQAEMEKRAQQRHDAAVKARQKEAQEEARAAERAAKQRAKAAEQEAKAEEKAAKDAAKAAEQAAQAKQKAVEAGKKAEQRAAKQAESSSLTYDKLTNKLTQYYHNFAGEIQKNPALMAQYEQVLNNLNLRGFGQNMTQAAAAVQQFQIACEQAGVGANGFIKKIISGFSNKLFYGGMAKLAAEVRRLVREIYTAVKDIDSSLTQLRIVTGGSAEDMARYYDDAAASAQRLAVSIKDVIDATTVYARLGYSARESNVLAEYTAMLTKVGDIDTQAATDAVTALVKAFDLDVSDVQAVMDQMVEVGNNFPISVSQLAEGMNNAGSALAAAGNTVDEAFALLTAANTTVQDISKASTALRTMSARIRKTTAEEMPEGEEAITESKYNALVQSLSQYKVSLVDINNEYRSTYDIIKDIAAVWDQMSSMEQAALAESIAGTRNQNVFYSLVNQFKEAEGALDAVQNASGAMSQAYDAYLESIEGHIGTLKADFQDLSTTILNSNVLKFGIDVVDGLVKIVDYLAEIKVLIPGIFALISGINFIKSWQSINSSIDLFMTSMKASTQMTGSLASSFMSLNQVQQQYALNNSMIANDTVAHGIKQLSVINALDLAKKRELATTLRAYYVSIVKTEAEIQDALALRGLSDAQLQQAAAAEAGEVANMGFAASLKAMWASNPVGLIMMVASLLASVLIPVLNEVIVTAKEAREQYEQETSELNSLKSEYETNAARIEELNNLKATDSFSDTNQRELEQLQDKNTQLERELALKQAITDEDRKEAVEKSSKKFNGQLYYTGNGLTNAEGVFAYADTELVKIEAAFASLEASGLYETDSRQYAQKKAEIEAWQESVYKTVRRVLKNYDEVKDYLNEDTHAVYDSLVDKWVGLILGKDESADTKVENPIEQVENGIVASAKTITSVLKQLGVEITAIYGKGGKVDLVNRPSVTVTSSNLAKVQSWGIDAQLGDTMTVASQTYRDAKKAIVVTPILPDGSMLTQDELDRYIDEVILKTARAGDGDYAKNDEKGLIMAVFGDKGTWEENLAQSDEFANKVHEIHEMLLSDVFTPEEAEAARRMLQALVPNADAMNPLDTLRDDLAALSTAFKDLSAEGSLGVTYKSLSQIRERFADVDGIDTYINRLAAAGTNAKEVQGILRELAYQQIIASDNSEALANASDDVIEALLREAGVASDGKQAIYELRLAMIAANTTGMDFSQQCSAILEIAAAAGVATASLRNMFKAAAGEYSERTGEDYSGNLDEYGYVYGTEARRGQYQNSQQTANTAWITKQAAAAGLSVEQFTIQKAYEQIRKKMLSSFEFSGDNGTTGGSGGSVEDYVADIDKYREAIHKLNQIQEERAKLERTIEHTDDPWKQIGLLSQETGLYQQEQKALHTLNNLRRATITENIKQLENLGFVVQYNADTNDLWIENLEHLNELDQKIIKETEELCDQTVELNKANQEASENWWELKDSIAKTDTQINELLQTIVDNASKAVDSMQSVYDTLHKAADEYASSGFVTIDTVQALIGLGTEYMQYLLDENGQLVINEERIKAAVKAKMEQLAVDNALVYVEALSIAKTKDRTEELNRLLFATEAATQGTWELVYAQIDALKLSDEERAAAYHNVNSIRALAQSAGDAVGNEFEQMKRGVDDILKYVQDMLKHQSQEAIDALNKQKEAYSEIIDQQKEALQLKKKENDYNKSVEQKLKDIAKLQAQIDALSLDNSREAQAQRAKLLEDLANLQEDLAL